MLRWFDRITTGAVLFLIFFTPLAFGSVHTWAFSLLEIAIFILVALWMAKLIIVRGERLGVRLTPHSSPLTPLVLPLTLFFVLLLFQMIPLPPAFLRVLSPSTYELYQKSLPGWPEKAPYEDPVGGKAQSGQKSEVGGRRAAVILPTPDEVRRGVPVPFSQPEDYNPSPVAPSASRLTPELWLPLTIDPSLTRTDLLKFVAYSIFFFFILLYPFRVSDRWSSHNSDINPTEVNFIRAVLMAVLLSGLIVATIGIAQTFAWNGKILWFFVPYDWGAPLAGAAPRTSGPFVNPAQFGNYLALVFFLSLAGALCPTFIPGRKTQLGFRLFCGVAGVVILFALLLSVSRGAWIGALAGLTVFSAIFFRRGKKKNLFSLAGDGKWAARLCVIGLSVAVVLSLVFVGAEGRPLMGTRGNDGRSVGVDFMSRLSMWSASLKMFRDFPLWGIGLGSWPDIFPRYRSAPWSFYFLREAHNDYVQVLAETGILGFGLLALFFWRCGKMLLSAVDRLSARVFPVYTALLSALAAMAAHEFFDFNLQVPANALLFFLLLALALRMKSSFASPEIAQPEEISTPGFRRPWVRTLAPAITGCASLILIFIAFNQEVTPYPYNVKEPVSVAEARQAIFAHPARAAAHYYLVQQARSSAAPSWLARELEIALWLDPNNPYPRDLYAALLFQQGRKKEALEEVSRSVFLSPFLETHAYVNSRFILWLSADEQTAVETGLKRGMAQGNNDAFVNLGLFYEQLHRYLDAGKLYEDQANKTRNLDMESALFLKAGYCYAMGQDGAKADEILRRVISASPSDPTPYLHLVTLVYAPQKNLAAAKALVLKGIKNGANPVLLYLSLADAAEKAQDVKEEKTALQEALKLTPSSAELNRRLGHISFREKDFDRSALYFQKAADLNPQSAQFFFHLAEAEGGRYRFSAAEKAYKRALELDPEAVYYRERYEAFKQKVSDSQRSDVTQLR
jgi:O-antigen ligase/Tfp pilus assembly protein PilF